ncbi:hypothetical protein [Lentzea californiensis]|uniref:hypothetical protein n=1 Tax=Lentzea californiensis TaxID=438851 RepID=UPI002165CACB|nr:hypothetical protein [Lentzea californiensis]MCR3749368.1 hypothetical protein [Lentzea californiensis]
MNEGAPGRPSDVYSRYGVQRHAEVQTGQEVQERVTAEVQGQYGPFLGMVMQLVEAPNRVNDVLDAQAAQLKQQVLTRSAPGQPDANYIGIPHQQLHESVNNGVDAGAIGEIADVWTQIGNELATFNDEVATAIGSSEADWTGKAGDGARQALANMSNRAGETGTAAQLAGTLFTQQARALSDAKNNVPPPPAQPFDAAASRERLMSITDPIAFVQQVSADQAAFQQQQADHEQAARAVETYDRTVAQTAAAQPAFAPEPPAPPKEPVDPGRPPIAPNPGFTGQGNTPPPRVGNDTTNTSWTAPPTSGTGGTNTSGLNNNLGGNGPNLGNQGGNNQLGGNTNLNLGGPLPGPNSGSKSTQGGPGGRAGGGPAGRGGSSGTGGTGGGRLPGGSAGLGNPNAAKGFGPGGSAGVMPGGESAAGRGGAAAGGGAGRGGTSVGAMGGMGAGAAKGQGDEDIERTSPSYLLEPDPDEIFGNDTLVAPPVLGE